VHIQSGLLIRTLLATGIHAVTLGERLRGRRRFVSNQLGS
jgi:hypothetical protein